MTRRRFGSEYVELDQNEEYYYHQYYYVNHIFPHEIAHFQVFCRFFEFVAVFGEVFAEFSQLIKIFIPIQKHFKALRHDILDIHQFLVELRDVLRRACVTVLFALFVDYTFEL